MARVRRTTGPLDLRAQAILRAVIEEYVTTAAPVGSQALVERYRLGVSSATVRNVLAELENAGLLEQRADRFVLTIDGRLLSNEVFSRLL